ncbi:MAG: hypothetical protein ABW123_29695 [Cystobacter sp.]
MNAQQLLTRLQDSSPDGPLDRLAALVVEHELSQPLHTLLPPALLARAVARSLEGALASPGGEQELASALQYLQQQLGQETRTVREALPSEFSKTAVELASRRYSPDRALVLAVLDRPPVRTLVGALLRDVLIEFSRKVSAPVTDNRLAKGFSGLARFAAEQARNSGTLGGIAGALSDEIERQVERKARDFVDSALSGIFQQVADALSEPSRHAEHAELRVALLDGVLGLPLARLGHELSQVEVPGGVAVVRRTLSPWLASGRAVPELEALLLRATARDGQRPVREVLGALGLLATFQAVGRESVRGRLGPIVGSEPFARWLEDVMREP